MTRNQISTTVDRWIREQDLPPRPGLEPIRRFSDLHIRDPEEQDAYWDYIHWFITQDYALVLALPKPAPESDFWMVQLDEAGNNVSAFNTIDYERLHPFNRYAYKLKKIYERVEDLAILHSCISQEAGRANIRKRFRELVDEEFRNQLLMLVETYKKYAHLVYKEKLLARVAELNMRIQVCKNIWAKHAHSV